VDAAARLAVTSRFRRVPSPDTRVMTRSPSPRKICGTRVSDAAGRAGEQDIPGAQGHAVAELGDEPLEPEGHLLGRRVLQQLALTSHWIRSRYG